MEDVLEVYSQPHDETLPVICMDRNPFSFLPKQERALLPTALPYDMRIMSK
jgi:hypothetical protein